MRDKLYKIFSLLLSIQISNTFAILDLEQKDKLKTSSKLNAKNKVASEFSKTILFAGSVYIVLRYIVNKSIFIGNKKLKIPKENSECIYKYYEFDNLEGCSVKLNVPTKNKLTNKCVLVFSPQRGSAAYMVNRAISRKSGALYILLNSGAELIGIDYRGYGNSQDKCRLTMSESTIYSDGEKMYDYVTKNLNYKSEDIVLFAYSMGASVASHVLTYASTKNQNLGGLILASPIDNLYSAASAFTCRLLGAVARVISMSDLNTAKNLSKIKDKNLPIFICSGNYENDVLSIEYTKLHEKILGLGFENLTYNISNNCRSRDDLNDMFYDSDATYKKYENFIEQKLVRIWESPK